MTVAPTSEHEAMQTLRESEKINAELAALRPKTNWLVAMAQKIIAENHLSEKVRDALEAK